MTFDPEATVTVTERDGTTFEVSAFAEALSDGMRLWNWLTSLDSSMNARAAIYGMSQRELHAVVVAKLFSFKQESLNFTDTGAVNQTGPSYDTWCSS